MALLTGVAPATDGAAAPGNSSALEGTDFLGALLAAAPAAPQDMAAESLLPVTPAADDASTEPATSAELAALIATLLPAAPADAAPATTQMPDAVEGEAAATGAATSRATHPAKALEQLLQRLAQEAGGTSEHSEQQAPLPGGPAEAAKVTSDAGLQQLLRAMTPRAAAPAPQVTMPRPGARGGATPTPQAFALPQAAAEVALRATAAAPPAADTQPGQLTALTAGIEAAAPAPSQSPSPQVQPQLAVPTQPQPSQVATPAAPQTVHNPVGTPRWAEELGSHMMLMSVRGQHEGSLNLSPEHLGPLEVRVSVSQGTTNVWFGAQHADTRAALAEALPRLRELFADAGLLLGHAGVSQEAPRQGPRSGEAERLAGPASGNAVDEPQATAPAARRVALGLVDTYA